MQAKGEYCITAGEFAKMCQTTRDTLRYYERQGILVPKKNPVNGYRYYSYAQISSYYLYGHSGGWIVRLEISKNICLAEKRIRFDEFVEQQYDKLLLMRQELDRKIRTIAGTRQILDQIRIADQGHPVIREIGDSWYFIFTEVISKPATSSGEIEKDIRRHLKRCDNPGIQAFPMGASIDKEQFLRENYTYKNVFSFTDEDAGIKKISWKWNQVNILAAVSRESDGDISRTYGKSKTLWQKKKKTMEFRHLQPEYCKRHRSE